MKEAAARALIRAVRTAGGATFNAEGQHVSSGDLWVYPAHPGRTLIVGPLDDWETHLRLFTEWHEPALQHERPEWRAFGAWIHPDGCLYLDIVTGRTVRAEAVYEALAAGTREGRQIAVLYRASTGDVLRLQPEFDFRAPPAPLSSPGDRHHRPS